MVSMDFILDTHSTAYVLEAFYVLNVVQQFSISTIIR